jgi:uncharacterized protein (TIGR00730 family)
MTDRKHVTVFGGSTPRPGDSAYLQALQLGDGLARHGFAVLTGGYIGTMEAVSRGAAEAGGHVIGVTCDEIESWRAVEPNRWVQEERRYATLRERLYVLIEDCDAALALPGGIGTLAEVAVMWSQMQVGAMAPRPLILIVSGWRETLNVFQQQLGEYVPLAYRSLLLYAADVPTAVRLVVDAVGAGSLPES